MFQFIKYKSLLLSYIITILIVFLGVGVVFGSNLVFKPKVNKITKLSNNIFLDSNSLNNNIVIYSSLENLSSYRLSTSCKIKSKYLGNKFDKYYFWVSYGNNCLNPYLYLKKDGKVLVNSQVKFNLISKSKLFELFSDLNDKYIYLIKDKIIKDILFLKKKKLVGFKKIINNRLIQELNYKLLILNNLIKLRQQKYLLPVAGVPLPINLSKIPNSARPYRAKYTDGIHHGWDFDTTFRHNVRAIDSGVIVRVISNFKFDDLKKIKKTGKLTYIDKLNNLNLLRGNQIWLKTSKGDVVFYSHLNYIDPNIKKGVFVNKGEIIGKVGISGVPDKTYKDYHLHFPIQKNPHIFSKVGKYTYFDYENWNWMFKNKSSKYILQHQSELFKN